MPWTAEECKAYVERALQRIREDETASISILRERGFVVSSWLLRVHQDRGTVKLDDYERLLLQLINIPNAGELQTLLENRNTPDIIEGIFYPNSITITDEMVEAISEVLSDPKRAYNIYSETAYLDDVTGFDYLSYICGIVSPPRPLVDIVAHGFTKALSLSAPQRWGDMRVIVAPNWRFMLSVAVSSSYLDISAFSALHEMNLTASSDGTINVMCCCTPIDKAVSHIANSSPCIFYMWELSIITLFNRLKPLISQYKVNSIRDNFIAIFDGQDKRKGAYSSYRAINKLEEAIKKKEP